MMSSNVPSPLKMQGLDELLTKDKENSLKSDLNVKDSLKYLNHQLSIQGFPSYLNLKGLKKEDATHVIECIFALIQQHQKDNDYKQEMMSELRKLALDNDTLNSNMDKLKQKYERSQHELKTLNNKIIELTQNNKAMTRSNGTLKEKIKHAQNTLQSLKTQYVHEIRKKEIELQKLKENLQKKFNGSMVNSGVRFHLSNPLSKIDMSTNRKSSNEDMFSILISNYENSEKELHNENCLLRQTLYDIYKEVELILGVEEDEQEFDPNNSDEVTNILVQNEYIKPEDAQFKLPLSISREYLGQRINDLLEQFKEYIFSIQDETNSREQESINNDEIDNKSKDESNMQVDEDYSSSKSSSFVKEQERKLVYEELKQEYLKIEKQKEQLETEKKKFTEAAVRMGKERALLAKEKESLENEKKSIESEKQTPINQSQINSYSYSNTELSNTPIAHSDKKSFSYSSITSNLSTPIPTKLSPHLNKPSYIDNSLNITNLKKSDPSSSPAPPHPLSSNSSSNVPVMLSSSKPSRSLRNINTRDEFLIRNKEKDDISAILNQALERINRNKQSFLSLSKTYSLRNNSEFNS
ncbi:Afadin and alpha-actinin-binding-domain-containing protein [Neocallimastix sp. 'constans']